MDSQMIGFAGFVIVCGGILWRMSSILTKLEASIVSLNAELARVHKDREGVEKRLTELGALNEKHIDELSKRVDAIEAELADARVMDAKFEGRISSLDRKRSIRPTEYQITDAEHMAKRKPRPRK